MYRRNFRPSEAHAKPYVILGINVVAAETDADARFLASSGRQAVASLRRGVPIKLPPPSAEYEKDAVVPGQLPLQEMTSVSMVGSRSTVEEGMRRFLASTGADELMIVSHVYDHAARVRSYEIAAECMAVTSAHPGARNT